MRVNGAFVRSCLSTADENATHLKQFRLENTISQFISLLRIWICMYFDWAHWYKNRLVKRFQKLLVEVFTLAAQGSLIKMEYHEDFTYGNLMSLMEWDPSMKL